METFKLFKFKEEDRSLEEISRMPEINYLSIHNRKLFLATWSLTQVGLTAGFKGTVSVISCDNARFTMIKYELYINVFVSLNLFILFAVSVQK